MFNVGKIMGYVAKTVRKAPKTDIISKVNTNTSGRILRMQNAKQAFMLGKNYQIISTPMQNTSGYKLVTEDTFVQRLAQMYPERTTATRIAELQKRLDCRAAFKYLGTKPQSRWSAVLQNEMSQSTNSKLKLLEDKANWFKRVELPKINGKIEYDFHKNLPKESDLSKIRLNSDEIVTKLSKLS